MTLSHEAIQAELTREEERLEALQRDMDRIEEEIAGIDVRQRMRMSQGSATEARAREMKAAALEITALQHSDTAMRIQELRQELETVQPSNREWMLRFMDSCQIYKPNEVGDFKREVEQLHPDELFYRDTGPNTPWLPLLGEEREKLLRGEVE